MQITINKEEVIRLQGDTLGVAPTTSGYTLAYSFDRKNWTNWEEAIPAGEPLVLNGAVPGMYVKLVGNADEEVQAMA